MRVLSSLLGCHLFPIVSLPLSLTRLPRIAILALISSTSVSSPLSTRTSSHYCAYLALPPPYAHKVMSSLGVQGAAATDDEVVDAMHVAWDTVKLMLEPSGAVALAALLHGRIDLPADESLAVGITASGANITMADYMQIVKGRTTVSRS